MCIFCSFSITRSWLSPQGTDRYENISQWQRMAGQLLNSYAERLYRFVRGRWEAPYIEVVNLTINDPSMMKDDGDHYLIESTELAESVDDIATIEELVVNLRDVVRENMLARSYRLRLVPSRVPGVDLAR